MTIDEQLAYLRKGMAEIIREEDLRERLVTAAKEGRPLRVKAGFDNDFRTAWRAIAAAHTKANMDEHWAVYEVDAGAPDLTFYFMYPRKTLSEIDKSGPMHGAAGYRDAVGETGRNEQREMFRRSLESSQTLIFKFRPAMSVLTKEWTDTDPATQGFVAKGVPEAGDLLATTTAPTGLGVARDHRYAQGNWDSTVAKPYHDGSAM